MIKSNITPNDWLNLGKFMLAGILFVGYFLILILAMFFALPPDAGTIVLQGLAVLGPVIGAVATSMWPRGNDQDRATIQALAQRPSPAPIEPKVIENDPLPPIPVPAEIPVDGGSDAPWFDPSSPRTTT